MCVVATWLYMCICVYSARSLSDCHLCTHTHTHTHQTTVNIVQFVDFLTSKGASKDEAMEVSVVASPGAKR